MRLQHVYIKKKLEPFIVRVHGWWNWGCVTPKQQQHLFNLLHFTVGLHFQTGCHAENITYSLQCGSCHANMYSQPPHSILSHIQQWVGGYQFPSYWMHHPRMTLSTTGITYHTTNGLSLTFWNKLVFGDCNTIRGFIFCWKTITYIIVEKKTWHSNHQNMLL